MVKWLVLVKIYGNSPKKLLNNTNEKIEIKINVDPFNLFGPNKFLNSIWSLEIIKFHKIKCRFGINQKENGKNNNPNIVLIQFNGILNKLVEGSKIENKLLIIFKYYFFLKNYKNLF